MWPSFVYAWLAAACIGCAMARDYGFATIGHTQPEVLYSLKFPMAKGQNHGGQLDFSELKGRTVLVTNVASECGYTANNYEQLKKLKDKYGDSLAIILIPSNDFGEQEPAPEEDISAFFRERGGDSYYTLAKSHVNGPQQHALIALLKRVTRTELKDITWNFESKFLISPDGIVVTRYSDAFEPIKLMESIDYYVNMNPEEEL
jgi:glutathione peroxidase